MSKECSTGWVDLPEDSPLFVFLTDLSQLNSVFLLYFVLCVGPINILTNSFVMFVLTRKELRSTYNIVFFSMALDQTIIIGSLTINAYRTLFIECNPQSYSLFWAIYEFVISPLDVICRAHATWLAVVIALMRLRSIRSNGTLELDVNVVIFLCVAALAFVIMSNTPNFLISALDWVPLKSVCDAVDFGYLPNPRDVIVKRLMPLHKLLKIHLYGRIIRVTRIRNGEYIIKLGDDLIARVVESRFATQNDCLVLRLSSFLTGTVHNALPCLLLIALTITLLLHLKKVRRERAKLMQNCCAAKEQHETDRSTTLLILVMINTMITEIPLASLSLMIGFLTSKARDIVYTRLNGIVISTMLVTSACNLLIYLFMSKKFREVAKRYVCCICTRLTKIRPKPQQYSSK